jgi:hypothetical protein
MELPRDFMTRFAQSGKRIIWEYRDELLAGTALTGNMEALRYVGYEFASAEAARKVDDRPENLVAWFTFPTWAAAEVWMRADPQEGGRWN